MQLEEIDVFIEKDGQVRIEVRGVKGAHCLAVTKDLEHALGGQVVKREMTPEANVQDQKQAEAQQWQRGA
ncbi:MAG: DUF2997 domain-containing protein [Verrucomicrobia bacterium]|nr:DUF2997 domain-containing protein [Verrucomicrobiota bacterium]